MTTLAPLLLSCFLSAPPIVEQSNEHEWTVRIEVNVRRDRRSVLPGERPHEIDVSLLNLRNTPVVFPILPTSTFHTNDVEKVELRVRLDGRSTPAQMQLTSGYPFGVNLATWTIAEFTGYRFSFEIEQNITAYSIKVRHDIAQGLDWPDRWPGDVREALEPELFIESDDPDLVKLVKSWTRDNVRSVPPYLAAKAITGQVIEYVQPSGRTWLNDRHGRFAGFDLTGAKHVLETRRGTANDLISFHVACLRAAGIPARPVIGLHARKNEFKVWTEFYLHDVERDEGVWLPIDFMTLRGHSSRAHPLDRRWPGFAEMEDTELLAPLSYHFHPPTAARSAGAPALWGFDPRPTAEPAEQYLAWQIYGTPQRAR